MHLQKPLLLCFIFLTRFNSKQIFLFLFYTIPACLDSPSTLSRSPVSAFTSYITSFMWGLPGAICSFRLPVAFAWFPAHWDVLLYSKKWPLEIKKITLKTVKTSTPGPLSFPDPTTQIILPSTSLNRPKSHLLKCTVTILLFALFSLLWTPKLFHLTVTAAKTIPNPYIFNLSFLCW